jgi:hypothetical protein
LAGAIAISEGFRRLKETFVASQTAALENTRAKHAALTIETRDGVHYNSAKTTTYLV